MGKRLRIQHDNTQGLARTKPVRRLTLRQERFIEAYLGAAKGNGAEAARLAGYSGTPHVLSVTAADLLASPAIVARTQTVFERLGMNQEWAARQLKRVAEDTSPGNGMAAVKAAITVGSMNGLLDAKGQASETVRIILERVTVEPQRYETARVVESLPQPYTPYTIETDTQTNKEAKENKK